MTTETITTPGGFIRAEGTEARVIRDIADRQQFGIAKYKTTVEKSQLTVRKWLEHQYQELLDAAIYCRRAMEEIDKEEGCSGK